MSTLPISRLSKNTRVIAKALAEELKPDVSELTKSEVEENEDVRLLKRIIAGAKSGVVPRETVFKKLGRR